MPTVPRTRSGDVLVNSGSCGGRLVATSLAIERRGIGDLCHLGRPTRPHRSVLLGPARLGGSSLVRNAARSLESQGGGLWCHQEYAFDGPDVPRSSRCLFSSWPTMASSKLGCSQTIAARAHAIAISSSHKVVAWTHGAATALPGLSNIIY